MEVKRRPKTWIVVADGRSARVYRIAKGGTAVEPVAAEFVSEAAAQQTRELGTDRSGVIYSSRDGIARAVEPTDWQRQEKAQLARQVAGFINAAAGNKAFDALVIAAAPRTLGDLRAALSEAALARIKVEVPKDLAGTRPHELLAHLADILPLGDVKGARRAP